MNSWMIHVIRSRKGEFNNNFQYACEHYEKNTQFLLTIYLNHPVNLH